MSKNRKTLNKIYNGSRNISFHDFQQLLKGFGFYELRTRGSHFIFSHDDISEIVNIQDVKGQVKPYQVRQFLQIIEKYNLVLKENE